MALAFRLIARLGNDVEIADMRNLIKELGPLDGELIFFILSSAGALGAIFLGIYFASNLLSLYITSTTQPLGL